MGWGGVEKGRTHLIHLVRSFATGMTPHLPHKRRRPHPQEWISRRAFAHLQVCLQLATFRVHSRSLHVSLTRQVLFGCECRLCAVRHLFQCAFKRQVPLSVLRRGLVQRLLAGAQRIVRSSQLGTQSSNLHLRSTDAPLAVPCVGRFLLLQQLLLLLLLLLLLDGHGIVLRTRSSEHFQRLLRCPQFRAQRGELTNYGSISYGRLLEGLARSSIGVPHNTATTNGHTQPGITH
jgi:hypothetical protein